MSFNQTNPNFANYQNSQLQAQGINPAPFPQIPYKPITFEKLSNLIGITYNLSAIENINTIPLPRGSPCCSPSNNLRSINGTTPTSAPALASVEEVVPSVSNTKSVESKNGK